MICEGRGALYVYYSSPFIVLIVSKPTVYINNQSLVVTCPMRSGQVKTTSCQEDCIEAVDYSGESLSPDIMQETINSRYVRKALVYASMNVPLLTSVKNAMPVNANRSQCLPLPCFLPLEMSQPFPSSH